MKDFLNGIGKAMSWLFGRLPSPGESIRAEIERLEREYDRIIQKPTSIANVKRLSNISSRLRVLNKKAANKTA